MNGEEKEEDLHTNSLFQTLIYDYRSITPLALKLFISNTQI